MRFLLVFPALLLTVSLEASPIQDPRVEIDTGGDAISISTGLNQVQPCGQAPCNYDFVNDSGHIVTSFLFETTVLSGLSSEVVSSNFSCADPGGYFLNCTTTYTSATGDLKYAFSGVNPADGDENGTDTEAGEMEGIPLGGHFIVGLDGWEANEALFINGTPPRIMSSFTTDAPEPSPGILLGTGLMFIGAVIYFRRRSAC